MRGLEGKTLHNGAIRMPRRLAAIALLTIRGLLHPINLKQYLRLVKLMNWRPHSGEIKCDDLFIVTSCTNPADTVSVVNHNVQHNANQRCQELLATFDSIRKHYPSAVIVNLENSCVDLEMARVIKNHCDMRRDYSSDPAVRFSRTFSNKGVPWAVKLLKFLTEEGEGIKANRMHLICGRYVLKEPLLATCNEKGVYFKFYPTYRNVSTRYFMYKDIALPIVVDLLKRCIKPMSLGTSLEDVIHKNCGFRAFGLDRIGISGTVNGIQQIEE